MVTQYLESKRNEAEAVYVETVKAGAGWMHPVKKGQVLRIVDLNGNQAVDTIFYNADDIYERYSVQQTVQAQKNALVGVGTELRSNDDNVMLKVVADTCGDHDTLGSACSCESNMIRYGFHTRYMRLPRDLSGQTACDPGNGQTRSGQQSELFHVRSAGCGGPSEFCGRDLLSGKIH